MPGMALGPIKGHPHHIAMMTQFTSKFIIYHYFSYILYHNIKMVMDVIHQSKISMQLIKKQYHMLLCTFLLKS